MSVQDLYEAAYCQDIGARHEQQDRVEILWSDAACLVVLADGLGGHIRGAFAAQTAIDLASSTFERATPRRSTPGEIFKTIVLNANERLNDAAEGLFSRGFPGTTCVLLHLTKAKACWTHLGDSRLYRFKDGRITEKTNDHSYPGGGMSACLGAGFNSQASKYGRKISRRATASCCAAMGFGETLRTNSWRRCSKPRTCPARCVNWCPLPVPAAGRAATTFRWQRFVWRGKRVGLDGLATRHGRMPPQENFLRHGDSNLSENDRPRTLQPGLEEGHCAYESCMDRDKDGRACER